MITRWARGTAIAAVTVAMALSAAVASAHAEGNPQVARERARHITQTDAQISAQVAPGDAPTTYKIWLEDPCPFPEECLRETELSGGELKPGNRPRTVTVDLADAAGEPNIEPDTTYVYWVEAQSGTSSTEGAHQAFTTLPPGSRPIVVAEHARHTVAPSTDLVASIDTGALDTQWELWLEDPCPAPQECIRDVRLGQGNVQASTRSRRGKVALENAEGDPVIEPGVPYRFWVDVRNSAGATEGEHEGFSVTW
jgi:hypothetical protein